MLRYILILLLSHHSICAR